MEETLLEVHGLAKSYGNHRVLNGVDLEVGRGTLVGIVGENGSGKSTLLSILAKLARSDSGYVRLKGRFGYCPQVLILNGSLTVAQHLEYFKEAYRLGSLARANELIKLLRFESYRSHRVGSLSGGTQQKLNLLIALMHEPDLLLLDEPYQGFDWETYLVFWDLVTELRDRGTAVLVISHLVYDQQRFDALYQLDDGVLHRESNFHLTHEDERP